MVSPGGVRATKCDDELVATQLFTLSLCACNVLTAFSTVLAPRIFVAMASFALAAGLSTYTVAWAAQRGWPSSEMSEEDVAAEKAGMRDLCDAIVQIFLHHARAAGWPKRVYTRRDVFLQVMQAHCPGLCDDMRSQLTHAFLLHLRAQRPVKSLRGKF